MFRFPTGPLIPDAGRVLGFLAPGFSRVSGGGTPAPDPEIDNVLYVNNEWTSFADQSPAAGTVTEIGTPVSDASLKLNGRNTLGLDGNSALHVDGTGSTASISNTGIDFTWEAWIYMTDTSKLNTVIGKRDTSSAEEGRIIYDPGTDRMRFAAFRNGSAIVDMFSDADLNEAQWYHVAISRESNTYRMFIDGITQADTSSGALSPTANGSSIYIGDNRFNTSRRFTGNMGPVRITRSVARYTGDFTPPALFPLT